MSEIFTFEEMRDILAKHPDCVIPLLKEASRLCRQDLQWFADNHGPKLMKVTEGLIQKLKAVAPEALRDSKVSIDFDSELMSRVLVMQHFTRLMFEYIVAEKAKANG